MAINDPISDMLTRIRNAVRIGRPQVHVKRNHVCAGIAQVLKDEGYINDFASIDDASQGELRLDLKYGDRGEKLIQGVRRVSSPGCRRYAGAKELPRVMDGLGISIISTSRGVISDRQARAINVGGELLCEVW